MIFDKKTNDILNLYFNINSELKNMFLNIKDIMFDAFKQRCTNREPFIFTGEDFGEKFNTLFDIDENNAITLKFEDKEMKTDYLFEMEDINLKDIQNLTENDKYINEVGGFTVYQTDINKSTDYSLQITRTNDDYLLSVITTSYICNKNRQIDDVVDEQILKGVVKKQVLEDILTPKLDDILI